MRQRVVFAIAGAVVIAAVVLVIALARAQEARGDYSPHVDAYRRVSDDMHVVVFVSIGFGDPILGYEVREEPDKVFVTVRAKNRDFGGFKNLAGYLGIPVTVTLRDPLLKRTVLDETGATVPEITCPDGTFSCFVGR